MCLFRYAEYGLAKTQGVPLASMQNAAGYYVQPDEVVNNFNVSEVFGNDFSVPASLVSGAWANVSLFQSSKPLFLHSASANFLLVPVLQICQPILVPDCKLQKCCAPVLPCRSVS